MSRISTTRRLISVYTEGEQWKREHIHSLTVSDIAEDIVWGMHLFQGLESFYDLRLNPQIALVDADSYVLDLLAAYREWLQTSEKFLKLWNELDPQNPMSSSDEFFRMVDEVRDFLKNLENEQQIPPIEELLPLARPDNPCPDRYLD